MGLPFGRVGRDYYHTVYRMYVAALSKIFTVTVSLFPTQSCARAQAKEGATLQKGFTNVKMKGYCWLSEHTTFVTKEKVPGLRVCHNSSFHRVIISGMSSSVRVNVLLELVSGWGT